VTCGIVVRVKRAVARRNRLATLIGFLFGGFVPVAIFFVGHRAGFRWEVGAPPTLIVGGLLFSAQTVYQWARLAFGQAAKAVGFCVLLEGVMVTTEIHWLAVVALGYLVVINGIATGCQISLGASGTQRRR